MSLLSGLDCHEKNPYDKWGRFSSSSADVISDFSNSPENDIVQLITLSPTSQPATRRSALQNHRQQKQKPIEIIDDKYHNKLRSNTDKNPKDFHVGSSSFTIPKTKKQTVNEKSAKISSMNKNSAQGEWIQTNGRRKAPTQLQLIPDAQGRAQKRSNTNENSQNSTPKKLRRPWLHASAPTSSDSNVSSQNSGSSGSTVGPSAGQLNVKRANRLTRFRKADTSSMKTMTVHIVDLKCSQNTDISDEHKESPEEKAQKQYSGLIETPKSRYCEEKRCPLCNAIITGGECFTCPKTSDEEFPDFFRNSDELSEDGFLNPAKRNGASGFRTEVSEREERGENRQKNDGKSDIMLDCREEVVSSQSQDNEFMETSKVNSSNITQDDIFCLVCGEARSKTGCGCSKPGVSTTRKRKKSPPCIKKNSKIKNRGPKQTTLDTCGQTKLAENKKTRGRKKKVVSPKEPECVHISSDEDETPETTRNVEGNNNNRNGSYKNDNAQDRMIEPMQDSSASEEIRSIDKKPGGMWNVLQESLDDYIAEEKKSRSDCINGVLPKLNCKKKKKLFITEEKKSRSDCINGVPPKLNCKKKKKLPTYEEEEPRVFMMVKKVLVGDLICEPREPVEITDQRMFIKVTHKDDNLDFKLEKNNIASFKIHSEGKPLVAIMTTTPGWARKYMERYDKFDIYMDPGSNVFSKRHILIILNEVITGIALEALTELIDCHLSDEPIVQTISQEEAQVEGERIISALTNKVKVKSQSTSSSSSETSNDLNRTKKSPPVIHETCSTRLKPSVVESSASKAPTKIGEEARVERQGKLSATNNKLNLLSQSKNSSSSQISSDLNRTKKSPPVVYKTYGTRSKSSVTESNAPKAPPKKILLYQPSTRLDGVTITSEDMLCLEPSTYLNDVIIDFFFKYIIEEKLTTVDRERLHLFSTFFYDKLTQKTNSDEPRTPSSMHRMVKSWTKNVDIFSKDFLIIPINESSHWFLVIICYPRMVADDAEKEMNQRSHEATCLDTTQESDEEKEREENKESDSEDFDKTLMKTLIESKKKRATRKKSRESVTPTKARPCILIFDSLGTKRRSGVMSNLRNYLSCEWKERKDSSIKIIFDKDTIKGCYPKVPLQENFSDCGLYVLQYFESFFTKPIEDYKLPVDLRGWFSQGEMVTKRQDITNVIFELQAKVESLKHR